MGKILQIERIERDRFQVDTWVQFRSARQSIVETVQFPDSLLTRVLRKKYFMCSSSVQLNKGDNPSFGWTCIMATKLLISLEIRQNVQSQNKIRVWEDFWIPTILARPATSIPPVIHPMAPVSKLLIGEPKIGIQSYYKIMSIRRISHWFNPWP